MAQPLFLGVTTHIIIGGFPKPSFFMGFGVQGMFTCSQIFSSSDSWSNEKSRASEPQFSGCQIPAEGLCSARETKWNIYTSKRGFGGWYRVSFP